MNTTTAFRDHISRLKSAISGKDIAVDLGLRRKGSRFVCPVCHPVDDGKTPDLSVFDKGFKCFKCGTTGDLIDLVVLAGKMSNADAIAYLERRTGITRPAGGHPNKGQKKIDRPGVTEKEKPLTIHQLKDEVRKIEGNIVHADLYDAFLKTICQSIPGTPGAEYLERRGIAADVADQYGVRFCSDVSGLWKLADKTKIKAAGLSSLYVFQKAGLPFLVFPYFRHGRPVFIKTRCLLSKDEADRLKIPRFLNTAGIVPCLWNHDAVADADQVLICEGEIDALSAIVKGFVAVGLPGWSHWKDAWTRDFAGKDIILVLDADAAGQKGTADIAKRFVNAGLTCPRQLILKEGKDLNDVLQYFMKT